MISAGETIRRIDDGNHLWIVVSLPTNDGMLALVNLTTHRPGRERHDASCLLIHPGEHPFVRHDSCVYFEGARLIPEHMLNDRQERGRLSQLEPVAPDLLRRVQLGALAATRTPVLVQVAIRATLERAE